MMQNISSETKLIIGTLLSTVVIIAGAVFFMSKNEAKIIDQKTKPADQSVLIRDNSYKVSTDSAKTTIVEFSDFQCPACGGAYPIVKKVMEDFPGKVNFVFRNFPLPQHQFGSLAAEVGEAAGEQGKFFEMYDLIYQNQESWSQHKDPMEDFTKFAETLKLDVEKFKKDVAANKYADKIQRDIVDGNTLGVNSTPTFYINGLKMDSYSYEDFKTIIEANSK